MEELCGGHLSFCKHAVVNSQKASVDKCEMACGQEVQRGADEFATVDKN